MTVIKFFTLLAISSLAVLSSASVVAPITDDLSDTYDHDHAEVHTSVHSSLHGMRQAHGVHARAAKKAKKTAAKTQSKMYDAGNSGSGNACKRGLAWSNHEADIIPKFKTDKVCFIYNWKPTLDWGMTTEGMEYIPMLWGQRSVKAFQQKVIAGYANYAAGMNEPDIPSQSNLSPADGAKMWNKYLCGLKSQGYTLLSPATATGPKWLQDFQNAGVCDWDITAVHVYTTSVDHFTDAVSDYRQFGKPIMVTEYACNDYSGRNQQCDTDQIWSFLSGVNGWMDAQNDILGYFFFAPMTASELQANNINGANALISSDGNGLTALGRFYINN
jgi:hypothetical protein